jgi:hypothetical protein
MHEVKVLSLPRSGLLERLIRGWTEPDPHREVGRLAVLVYVDIYDIAIYMEMVPYHRGRNVLWKLMKANGELWPAAPVVRQACWVGLWNLKRFTSWCL